MDGASVGKGSVEWLDPDDQECKEIPKLKCKREYQLT